MSIVSRQTIVALLFASYGLISACGAGLHLLHDDSHVEIAADCSNEHGHSSTSPLESDHSDCIICHVATQSQFHVQSEPISSGSVTIGEIVLALPIDPHSFDRIPCGPRAPPTLLA